MSRELKYRADIDGLRAFAVVLVIIFHAFPNLLPGGFVGVDVFFVISGFLISGIIMNQIDLQTFSLRAFYEARVRRIFPALAIVLLITMFVGRILYFVDEFLDLAHLTAASTAFLANVSLWRGAGYFMSASEEKPLLHLWSLGIEEQFYLVWPIILAIVYRNRRSTFAVWWFALALGGTSFFCNIWLSTRDLTADFFLPHARAWELIAGALLAIQLRSWPTISNKHVNSVCSTFGILAILYASIFFDGTAFPRYRAVLPVAGTCLFLLSESAFINRKVFSRRSLRAIGSISYPLYLWHWPFLVFGTFIFGKDMSILAKILLLTMSLVAAWLTYIFVESPVRFKNNRFHRRPLMLVIPIAAIGVFAFFYSRSPKSFGFTEKDKYVYHFSESGEKTFRDDGLVESYRLECDFYDPLKSVLKEKVSDSCFDLSSSEQGIFLWGNSHAQMLYGGLRESLSRKVGIAQLTTSACLPSTEDFNPDPLSACNRSNKLALAQIARLKPSIVLIAQNEAYDLQRVDKIIDRLKHSGVRRIIFIGTVPHWDTALYRIVARYYWQETPNAFPSHYKFVDNDDDMFAHLKENPTASYLSLRQALCDSKGCLALVSSDKIKGLITFDYGHLTNAGSRYVAKHFLKQTIEEELSHQLQNAH